MDEMHTLRRIIADCVASGLRYVDFDLNEEVDLFRLGDAVAACVIRRLLDAHIKVESDA